MTVGAIAIGLLLIVFIAVVAVFNGLIGRKNRVNQALSSVDVMLKKRCDLIPEIVAAVQSYMKHEATSFTKITELRGRATAPNLAPEEKARLDSQIGQALRGIMVQVENYPQLKASENFLGLQASLNEIEEQLSAARRALNAAVVDYNNAVEMFPSSVVARVMGYRQHAMFEMPEDEKRRPDVAALLRG